jgi:hypothetical protein
MSAMRRLAVLLAVLSISTVAVGAASAAPSAATGTTQLGWVERLERDSGTRVDFRVVSLETAKGGWKLRLEVTNGGTGPMLLAPTGWAIMEFADEKAFEKPVRALPARAFSPRLPETLAPGKSWKGTVSGRGVPDDRLWVRVVMGPFATRATQMPFTWTTDNALHRFTLVI